LRFFNRQKVKLVFSYDYYIGISTSNANQSFDFMKYKKIRDRLIKEKLIRRKNILVPDMVSYEDMILVHDEEYLKKIKDPLKVAQLLRISDADPWDSYILEFFRAVTGGTILAMEYVIPIRAGVVEDVAIQPPWRVQGALGEDQAAVAVQEIRGIRVARVLLAHRNQPLSDALVDRSLQEHTFFQGKTSP